jgi:hypothetical protein
MKSVQTSIVLEVHREEFGVFACTCFWGFPRGRSELLLSCAKTGDERFKSKSELLSKRPMPIGDDTRVESRDEGFCCPGPQKSTSRRRGLRV